MPSETCKDSKFVTLIRIFYFAESYKALANVIYKVSGPGGLNGVANSKECVSVAVKNNPGCGSSGSSESSEILTNIANDNENLGNAFLNLDIAFVGATDENGELTGNLDPVINAYEGVHSWLNSLSNDIETLCGNVDSESLNGLGKINLTLPDLTKSLEKLDVDFEKITGPKDLFESIYDSLREYSNSLKNVSVAVTHLSDSLHDKLYECKSEYYVDIPEKLDDFNDVLKQFSSDVDEKLQQ